ncbi:MAG TPA: ATP-binding protein [Candidatus Limnocylindria bacterium]|jgi:signal transduction histidine kinase
MRHIPRSRTFYLGASVVYAVLVFVVIETFYDRELAQAGLLLEANGPVELLRRTVTLHLASFALWTAFSVVAGSVAYSLAAQLSAALDQAERRGAELALISELSAGLSGPLGPTEVATVFLRAIRRLLPPTTTVSVITYEEPAASFRTLAQDGPGAAEARDENHPIALLPAELRQRLIGEHASFVSHDTAAVADWPEFVGHFPTLRDVRTVAALPLISRSRLIGALLVTDAKPGTIDRDQLQLLVLLGQYVAGALHNALSLAEAEARADRESVVNQVAQRLRGGVTPEEVLVVTLEEVGRKLRASRAIVYTGQSRDDLTVLQEWHTEGAAALPIGSRDHTPFAVLAAREGRTVAVRDGRNDPRLADPTLGPHTLIEHGTIAGLATPIGLGGGRSGVLVFHQVGAPRGWTSGEVRLVEAVARELRVALESARLFEQQRAAVAELERLSQAKSDFVSIVSHEFRTPLTGIQGFSEMMRDEDLSLVEMKEYAGDINKDAQRLNRMINEMLDLDRLESGRMTVAQATVDLNAIVTAVAAGVRPNAPGHPIVLRLDPDLGAVSGDQDKLTQVVVNLLSNAVKYSPEGGEIVVTTRADGPNAHVLVRDHGMGIPADGLEKVFDRFARLETNATRFIQGTGLGLPIVRQIVTLHGGRAWVESTVGEGSVFQFTIPLATPASV